MNELLFLGHVLLVVGFVLGSLRLGKAALITWISLQAILANLFVVKQIQLFGFSVTCSDVFAIGGILSLNLLQEYYGKKTAKQAIQCSCLALLFFALMSLIHLMYIPADFDQTQAAFSTIFASSFRIVAASLATFYLVQRFDVWFFGLLRFTLPLRVVVSLLFSQFLDTALFSFLGLYGLVQSLFDVILVSFLIKCIIVLMSSPFVLLSKRLVKDELSI